MTDDIDIWRTAKLLIDRHGDEAPVHVAVRADEVLADGVIAVKSKLDIHNGAVALRVMADLAMERLAEIERPNHPVSQCTPVGNR